MRILAGGGRIGQPETPQRTEVPHGPHHFVPRPRPLCRGPQHRRPLGLARPGANAFGLRQHHAPRRHAGAHRRRTREHQAFLPRGLRSRPYQRRPATPPLFAGRPRRREPASAVAHKRRLDRGGRQALPRRPARPARYRAQQLCRRAHDCRTGRARRGGRLRCGPLAGGFSQAPPRQLHRARL